MNDIQRLLEEATLSNTGFFALGKVGYVEPGINVPESNRCDNYTIAGTIVAQGTEYEDQCIVVGKASGYSDTVLLAEHVSKLDYAMFYPPHFIITYIEVFNNPSIVPVKLIDIQLEETPSSMWIARSIYQLFKNIREWSFMVDEPFNSTHPMATYSKIVIDSLNIPNNILAEIDAMPDMHLAKFLKGDPNYKQIPYHPVMSEYIKEWILDVCTKYPYITFEQQIS